MKPDETAIRRVDRGLIRVTGKDRLRWLQGMLTNDVSTLAPGGGCMAAACTRQGKMVGVMVVRLFEDHILLETEPESMPPLTAHFDKLIIMDDVKLEDVSSDWIGLEIFGAACRKIVDPGSLPWFHFVAFEGGIASSNRTTGPEGLTLIVPPETTPPDGEPLTEEAYETLRIENGFPRWGRDMTSDDLPMEANLEPIAVSYDKGCYLGQEVILRVRNFSEPPKRLVWLSLDASDVPAPGTAIRCGMTDAGRVTSSTHSPRAGHAVALGYVGKEQNKPGTEVQIDGTRAIVNPLPWHGLL